MEENEILLELDNIKNHILYEISNHIIVRDELNINNNILPNDLTLVMQDFLYSKNACALIENSNYNSIEDFKKSSSYNIAYTNGFVIFDMFFDTCLVKCDVGFDTFFAYKLKQTDLFQVDNFLTFQFSKNFNCDFKEYSRFLTLLIRKFSKTVLFEEVVITIKEWISTNSTQHCQNTMLASNINWTGDKVDFIKLMYALFHAKLINKGEGKITQIVSEASQYFNIKYNPKGSDLSVSLFNADENGYDKSTFIKDIESGFNTYLNTRNKD
ncbi:MAG: RteC protein [Bacteroidetes bacterium ADurb.Bin217]|nr:MAG: RteC protein [Bacteroidetes bacterium ADurb.Bin217]